VRVRFDTWIQDVRYAARMLRNSPLFAVTAALSLAIGIGANTTIFSLANALLVRPRPGLSDPGRLVDIGRTTDGEGFDTISYPNYRDIRDRARTVAVYAYEIEPRAMSLGGRGEAERVFGATVSGNYFAVLGTTPAAGRLLRAEDDVGGGQPVAVISHELWARRFASDASILGAPIVLNGVPFTVAGVAPRGFQGTTLLKSDVWIPIALGSVASTRRSAGLLDERRAVWLVMGGRLEPGASAAQAGAELSSIAAALEREFPQVNRGHGLAVAPSAVVPGRTPMIAGFLGVLMAIVGLVLLIACVNIAGMLLARAAGRRREIAVRLAVGAGRGRLVRQLLTETAILFALGGAAGLGLSRWLTALLLGVIPQLPFPIAVEVTTDWRVMAFAIAVSLVASVVSGLAPALQASRADLVAALKAEGLDRTPSRLRLRNAFVVGQVTMSLVLIVAAGLFLRSLERAAATPPGFDQTNVDVVSLDLSLARYGEPEGRAFVRALLGRVRGLPGVVSATAANDLPLDGGRMGLGPIYVPGIEAAPGRAAFSADWNIVEPGFFATLRLPLLAGRDFTDADTADSPGVIIINRALARRIWQDADPIGRRVEYQPGLDEPRVAVTVVGVTSDARLISLDGEVEPFAYVPLSQQFSTRTSLLVRTTGASAIPDVRRVVRELNPNLPVTRAMPLGEVTAISLVPQRLAASVAGSLGIVGLLLAAIGIYGVASYMVSSRTREIGIRMALGADRANVLRLVLGHGMLLAGIGVAIGLVLAAACSRFVESLLFGVTALDPVTFAGTCALFVVVSLAATYIPARRATRVEPVAALRNE
jgi:predicted permease